MSDAIELQRTTIDLDAAPEQVAEVLGKLAFVREQAKAAQLAIEAQVVEWIKVNGPLEAGTLFYWLGHLTEWKCREQAKALDALFQQSGGDFDTLARDFLSVNAIKCGAARRAIGDELFEKVTKDKLESGEALPKKLLSAAKDFI
jgi:hypothetical protein